MILDFLPIIEVMVLSSTNLFGLISVNVAQVTKTEMMTPTLSSFMSDVRSMDVSFESIPKYKIEKSVTYFSLFSTRLVVLWASGSVSECSKFFSKLSEGLFPLLGAEYVRIPPPSPHAWAHVIVRGAVKNVLADFAR